VFEYCSQSLFSQSTNQSNPSDWTVQDRVYLTEASTTSTYIRYRYSIWLESACLTFTWKSHFWELALLCHILPPKSSSLTRLILKNDASPQIYYRPSLTSLCLIPRFILNKLFCTNKRKYGPFFGTANVQDRWGFPGDYRPSNDVVHGRECVGGVIFALYEYLSVHVSLSYL